MGAEITVVPTLPAICRFHLPESAPHVGLYDGTHVRDLTATGQPWAASISALLGEERSLAALISTLGDSVPRYAANDVTLLAPIDYQEIWAAGVTYERSREAREQESEHAADMYARVYSAERPELFFKADARRTSAHGEPISVRPDSKWSVPEPELALVLSPRMSIVAYTIGNDVSARDIEGENPLYLPQAKVFDGGCALGPWLIPAEQVPDPLSLVIRCSIERQGKIVWSDETSTAKLHRRLDDLVAYLGRSNTFAAGAFLLTGTCLVPPDSLSLMRGDIVRIAITGLGELINAVG